MSYVSFRTDDYMYSSNSPKINKYRMHLHKYYEFLYFISGDATYIVENSEYSASAGDLFITRPNELHAIVFNSPVQYERKFVQISDMFLAGLDIDLLKFINRRPLGEFNKISAETVREYNLDKYFYNIEHYVVNRVPESDLMIKTYMIQFLVNINNIFAKNFESAQLKKRAVNPKIELIIKYINENLHEQIKLDTLADMLFINKYHLCHIFKEATGLSVKEYINTRRIAKAKSLITEGKDLTSVCFQCGFNDYSTFYKTFKRFTGKSPKKFLK